MAGHPRLPWHVGDYLRDTPPISRVSWEHHGIYLLALALAWSTPKCQIPNDPEWIAMRFGCTVDEYHEHVEPVLRAYFKCDGNFYRQKRLRQEHQYVTKQSHLQSVRRKSQKTKGKTPNRKPDPVEPETPSGSTPTPTPTLKQQESSAAISSQSSARETGEANGKDPPPHLAVGDQCLAILGWDKDAAKCMQPVHQVKVWLDAGAEPDRHIYPVMHDAVRRGTDAKASTLRYFDKAVQEAVETGTTKFQAAVPKAPPTPEAVRRNLEWKRDRGDLVEGTADWRKARDLGLLPATGEAT